MFDASKLIIRRLFANFPLQDLGQSVKTFNSSLAHFLNGFFRFYLLSTISVANCSPASSRRPSKFEQYEFWANGAPVGASSVVRTFVPNDPAECVHRLDVLVSLFNRYWRYSFCSPSRASPVNRYTTYSGNSPRESLTADHHESWFTQWKGAKLPPTLSMWANRYKSYTRRTCLLAQFQAISSWAPCNRYKLVYRALHDFKSTFKTALSPAKFISNNK